MPYCIVIIIYYIIMYNIHNNYMLRSRKICKILAADLPFRSPNPDAISNQAIFLQAWSLTSMPIFDQILKEAEITPSAMANIS